MRFPKIRTITSIVLVVLMILSLWWASRYFSELREAEAVERSEFQLSDRLSTLELVETADGLRFRQTRRGQEVLLTPDEFARELQRSIEQRTRRGLVFRIFDITSVSGVFWVCLGLFGQLLFTGRMLVQWIVSERRGESVVPNAFWWMSLAGASLLVIYFSWRIDIVGILGQATGWFVYVRNLRLIHKKAAAAAIPADD